MSPDDPRHGKITGYTHGCREECCRRARRLHETQRRRDLDRGIHYTVPAIGTIRRVQALMAVGWTAASISAEAGWLSPQAVQLLIRERARVRLATAERVAEVYERLAMQRGPSNLTARRAAAKGWPVPLAWDDDIDDPRAAPQHRVTAGRPGAWKPRLDTTPRPDDIACQRCGIWLRASRDEALCRDCRDVEREEVA